MPTPDLRRPHPDAYVIPVTCLAAGTYPGSPRDVPAAEREAKLAGWLDAGITAFIDLTAPADPLEPYAPYVIALGASRGINVVHERLPIRDMDVCDAAYMEEVLDVIDARLAEGHGVYVHCWGGIGRTGLVVGCWLVRHGASGDDALETVRQLFLTMSPAKVRAHGAWGSPQTPAQRAMVRAWESTGRRA